MQPPIVIGALGGSGTRVVARLVQRAGLFLGVNRNESEDAMEFVGFYDRWINRCIRSGRVPLTPRESAAFNAEFADCIERHRTGITDPEREWGWKEPRSIYLLPLFHACFPAMKFVHVVRDGRDMAFSSNQNQLRKHGSAVLDREYDLLPAHVRTAGLWNHINMAAADYGEQILGTQYLRVRFEDLCSDPAAVARQLFAFLGHAATVADDVIAEVDPPATIGRWRTAPDAALASAIFQRAQPALERFGYSA